ncbi:MAG: glycosyltransferase family 2 protein [Actinomycetota bacterium]|nr:glycosyltransferase family 2 protein [Actinomycetota bacterium]
MTIDVVIPARNEASTVADVVAAALACRYVREVIVVDDGSADGTGDLALAAGAKVVRRDGAAGGSKAHAMEAGVAATDAEALLFCDADLVGLTAAHLDDVCVPFVEGRATMSVGWFDYGMLNPLVLRLPPTTGERIVPRWVWDAIPPEKRNGYSIEIMINEVISEGRLPTSARIMPGVTHRTKRHKLGLRRGYRETWRMFWHLVGLPVTGVVRWRTVWFYLRALTLEP